MLAVIVSVACLCLAFVGFLKIHNRLNVGEFKLQLLYMHLKVTNHKWVFILLPVVRAYALCRGWQVELFKLNPAERECLLQLRKANRNLGR